LALAGAGDSGGGSSGHESPIVLYEPPTRARTDYRIGLSDHTNGSGPSRGYVISVLADGNKILSRFETILQTVVGSDGSRRSSFNTVTTLTGGTGKFSGIRGTLRTAGTTDFKTGLGEVKAEGEYWFEK
jgi:hypothetical protein